MAVITERRGGTPGVSPREAAFVTGLSEKDVNQAIDRDEVEALPARRREDRGRMLGYRDLLYLRVRNDLGRLLSPEGKRMLREQLAAWDERWYGGGTVSLGRVELNVAPEMQAVQERLARVEEARSVVVADPEVRGGEPVVCGTRISVYVLADLARQGAPREELLEDYPALAPETLDAALLYAEMHPRRGRPRRAPWKDGVVIGGEP
ncbi:MAG TPA: DUF433 domain-containing protein [Longimicrobiaceae bacterium]|jgi:uncharacterized protein (DUF433 family)|nr:DUF433 domain-containing protein [Longimicrobiaceae bacterium]